MESKGLTDRFVENRPNSMATSTQTTESPTARIPARKGRRRIPLGWVICGAILLAGIGWYTWRKLHPPDNVGPLILGSATQGDLIETVTANGSVEAQTGAQINIGSQVTGRIKHLYADVGQKVKAGETIAVLDLPDVSAAVSQAQHADDGAASKLTQSGQSYSLGLSQTLRC